MTFEELRVGHKIKCIRENALLPFKVNVEYEVVNVNDGIIQISPIGDPDTVYPLDLPTCVNYFDFTSNSIPVIKGFRRNKEEDEDSKTDNDSVLLKESFDNIIKECKEEEVLFNALYDKFGMTSGFIAIAEAYSKLELVVDNANSYDTDEAFDDAYKDSIKELLKKSLLVFISLKKPE